MTGRRATRLVPGAHRISPTRDSRETHYNGLLRSYRHLQSGVTIRSASDPADGTGCLFQYEPTQNCPSQGMRRPCSKRISAAFRTSEKANLDFSAISRSECSPSE